MKEKYKLLLINEENTIKDCMELLSKTSRKILLVTNNNTLEGIVADGDIRRAIYNGAQIDESIKKYINVNPITAYGNDVDEIQEIMIKNNINAVPIVNQNSELVDVCFLSDFKTERENKLRNIDVVIMAGGRGERLLPYTHILPKPLIPIGDTPIIERIIEKFSNHGLKKFSLILNYKRDMIKAYFNSDIYNNKYKFKYYDENEPLGTAGGLSLLKSDINGTFIMSNCDILVDIDYNDLLENHKRNENEITIVAAKKNFVVPYGTLKIDEDNVVRDMVEKPKMDLVINTGLYVVNSKVLDFIDDGRKIDFPDIIEKCMTSECKVATYVIEDDSWYDMGQIEEMEEMIRKIK